MAKQDFFIVENNNLVINKDYVRGIPEFKCILERLRRCEGDSDGRKKLYNWRELMYIYIRASMYSYPNKAGLSEKEVERIALKESGLEKDYKPDEEVKQAIIKYKEVEALTVPTLNSIATVLRSLKLSDDICKNLTKGIQYVLEKQEEKRINAEKNNEEINIAEELITTKALVDQLDQVLTIANKIPRTIEILESLNEKLSKEEAGDKIGRGGKKLGNRADPS